MSVLKIKDGSQNWQTIRTINGKTPVKGVDYWTDEDKDEIVDYVLESEEIEGKLDKPQTDGTAGQVLTSDGNGGQTWEDPTVAVEDVQINGTSVVSDGVAEIPIATNNESIAGVARFNGGSYGIGITNAGIVYGVPPSDAQIKQGTNIYKPIVSGKQHQSTFYGLAKAAGVDMASSANSVGTYTEEAKKAIRKMLGIPNTQGELIADVTAEEDLTEIFVTTDINGLPFKLSKIVAIFSAPPSTTGTKDYFYCLVRFVAYSDNEMSTSVPSYGYPTATSKMLARSEVIANPRMPISAMSVAGHSEGNSQNANVMPKPFIAKYLTGFRVYQSGSTKSLIPTGSNLKLYGIRYDD